MITHIPNDYQKYAHFPALILIFLKMKILKKIEFDLAITNERKHTERERERKSTRWKSVKQLREIYQTFPFAISPP